MTTLRSVFLFSAAIIFLLSASPANAQGGPLVEITNNSGEKRRICAYRGHQVINIVATRCFTMNAGEKVVWNRDGENSEFKVKVFESKTLLDKYLYARDLPADTTKIIIGQGGRFGFSRSPVKPKAVKYRLKVCNSRFDDKVWFTLGFETNDKFVTRGWWSVAKGDCIEVAVSELLRSGNGVPYGTLPRTYYYARTYGDKKLEWTGGDTGSELCINTKRAFNINQLINTSAGREMRPCESSNLSKVSFRKLDDPKANEEYYYLNF